MLHALTTFTLGSSTARDTDSGTTAGPDSCTGSTTALLEGGSTNWDAPRDTVGGATIASACRQGTTQWDGVAVYQRQ